MTDGHKCRNCGSISTDPEWCDICGADLTAQNTPSAWLEVGDTLSITLTPVSSQPPVQDLHLDDTLPPIDLIDSGPARPVPRDPSEITDDLDRMSPTRTLGRGITVPGIHTSPDTPGGPRTVKLHLDEAITNLGHKRVFRASAPDGARYRLEERSAPSPEPVPDAIRTLTWLVDVPLGATQNGTHEIKVYRHVDGLTMHERLEERDEPMTPSEIAEWMRPVAAAMQAIHDAGFLCLRLCPYTIKYTENGGVFLQGVEVLYPRDASLEKLPAIAGYTPPEVYAASVGDPPGPAADVYMAGMMIYYLIAESDPPASMYTGYTPAILARDFAPAFPLGFAPVLGLLGAVDPADRPADAAEFIAEVEAARDRSVRQIASVEALTIGVASDSHVGIVKRLSAAVNQDAVFHAANADQTTALLVVADGVSTATYGSGDLASSIARSVGVSAWRTLQQRPDVVRERGINRWLDDVMQEINRGIIDAVNRDHAPFDGEPAEVMGSTCLIALIQNGITHLQSLGDSRAYLIRNGFMEQINRDHNLLTLGIADGLDPDTAITLPQGDALAKCLGAFDIDDDGNLVAIPVEPDGYVFPLLPGDRLLLATDGLTDYAGPSIAASEHAIYQHVMKGQLPDLVCVDLLHLANAGGGGDNIGVALAFADPTYPSAFDWFAELREGEEPAADA